MPHAITHMHVRSDTIQIARKHYRCDACRTWLDSDNGEADVTRVEWLIIQRAAFNDWRILPGQKYRKVIYILDGQHGVYRARLDIDAICQRYGLFEEP